MIVTDCVTLKAGDRAKGLMETKPPLTGNGSVKTNADDGVNGRDSVKLSLAENASLSGTDAVENQMEEWAKCCVDPKDIEGMNDEICANAELEAK